MRRSWAGEEEAKMFSDNVRRAVLGGFAAGALLTGAGAPANAIPVNSQIMADGPGVKNLKNESAQNFSGFDVGDVLRGVLNVTAVENGFVPANPRPIGSAGVNALTALFEAKIAAVSCAGPVCSFRMTWNASFASDPALAGFAVPAGSHPVIALFEDSALDFDFTTTVAAGEATATNGLPFQLGGLDGLDDFWLVELDFSAITGPGSVFGGYSVASTLLDNPRGPGLGPLMTCTATIAGGASAAANFCASGNAMVPLSGDYGSWSEANLVMNVVPEPATLSLVSIGILGLIFCAPGRKPKANGLAGSRRMTLTSNAERDTKG
jgi:hypothetical protein